MANWINCRNEGSLHKKPDLHKQAMPGNGILEKPIRDQGQHTNYISFYTKHSFFEFLNI